MISLDQIVAEARSWDGTPFHWQQATKGRGCDCKGLIVGVARALDLPGATSIHAAMFAHRNGIVDARLLREGLEANLDRTDDPRPGHVLLLKLANKAQHLAILTELPGRMIHTNNGIRRVQEVRMGKVWWRQLDSAWAWRGIE